MGVFVLVMEDKADRANLCLKEADGTISMTVQATTDYAVNGALHYAQHILQKPTYKKVFAFGNAGDSKHHKVENRGIEKGIAKGESRGENKMALLVKKLLDQNRIDDVKRASEDEKSRAELMKELGIN